MNKKITKNKQAKQEIVTEITNKVQKAKGIIFTNYQGMTHKQLEGLKKSLKANEADFIIIKNSLLRLALNNVKANDALKNELIGPTAALIAYADPISNIKILSKVIKEINLPVVKFGLLEGKEITDKDITELSLIPSYENLIIQTVGLMQSPIVRLTHSLLWNIQKLTLTLNAFYQKQSNSSN